MHALLVLIVCVIQKRYIIKFKAETSVWLLSRFLQLYLYSSLRGGGAHCPGIVCWRTTPLLVWSRSIFDEISHGFLEVFLHCLESFVCNIKFHIESVLQPSGFPQTKKLEESGKETFTPSHEVLIIASDTVL